MYYICIVILFSLESCWSKNFRLLVPWGPPVCSYKKASQTSQPKPATTQSLWRFFPNPCHGAITWASHPQTSLQTAEREPHRHRFHASGVSSSTSEPSSKSVVKSKTSKRVDYVKKGQKANRFFLWERFGKKTIPRDSMSMFILYYIDILYKYIYIYWLLNILTI